MEQKLHFFQDNIELWYSKHSSQKDQLCLGKFSNPTTWRVDMVQKVHFLR